MKRLITTQKFSLQTSLKSWSLIPASFLKLPFERIKNDVLGRKYELSLVMLGPKAGRTLNRTYRQKDYATDILSFELDKVNGEIFIVPAVAKGKAKDFGLSFENYLLFLLIHGMLHLKGLDHGAKMDKYEFSYYNRYRHWHI